MDQLTAQQDHGMALNGQGRDVSLTHWETSSRLSIHEAKCEERMKTVFARLQKIDEQLDTIGKNTMVIGFTLICGMAGLLATLLLK